MNRSNPGDKVPIFLLSSERSGTNLLRRILGRHPKIHAPSPPHLIRWLLDREHCYGDLRNDNNFRRLVKHGLFLVRNQLDPWELPVEKEEVVASVPQSDRSVLGLVRWLYDQKAEGAGKERWFCKERRLAHYVFELAIEYPDADFIYLHRDPRDVYRSFLTVPAGPKHPYLSAKQWVEEQTPAVRAGDMSELGSRVHRVSYETLVTDPEPTVRSICSFLKLEFVTSMLSTPADASIRSDNPWWENIRKDIMRDNTGKFREDLSSRSIRIVEERAFRTMQRLDYDPEVATGPRRHPIWRRACYRIIHYAKKQWTRMRLDIPEHEREVRRRRSSFRRRLDGTA